ncbi:hypothetical protein DPMN_013855 [Dreissena polymorpha]|uniref:Uncharacterized protein n=1 Tax=Dreissena polymorpha TaxID=45954 RepID=A0A9D4N844_DREPO|nr:hypothetical protein DPMN_013855 [Dreissena polymorpha]
MRGGVKKTNNVGTSAGTDRVATKGQQSACTDREATKRQHKHMYRQRGDERAAQAHVQTERRRKGGKSA